MKAGKYSVLVVDDSRVSQTHLMQILQDEYVVYSANSGVEALQITKAENPDIILLDIVMPQMDGYETLAALKASAETKDIPVIFITSLDHDSNEEKGLRLGAADYISKPYNPIIVKLRISLQLQLLAQMRQISELSMMDAVSRLPNRRYFDSRLREEWQRAKNENHLLGVLLMDVDKLRSYNTIYGYTHGDAAILAISEIIAKTAVCCPGDLTARWAYGGFAVLLQNADRAVCNTVGENIRCAIESAEIPSPDGAPANLTMSIGANSVSPALGDVTLEQFISKADSSLFLAKELGRNRVVVHS
ncbi:MAG: diguanylate cyclase [Defluviitaleaceae bacterium]|nr:diguanylate cyclase [Defluviitaleaceae bacterium]